MLRYNKKERKKDKTAKREGDERRNNAERRGRVKEDNPCIK